MLIEMNREAIQETISLCEKFEINKIIKNDEKLEILPFGYCYTFALDGIVFSVKTQRKADIFFELLHERKNENSIKLMGEKRLFSFKEILEKTLKKTIAEIPK